MSVYMFVYLSFIRDAIRSIEDIHFQCITSKSQLSTTCLTSSITLVINGPFNVIYPYAFSRHDFRRTRNEGFQTLKNYTLPFVLMIPKCFISQISNG